MNWARSRRGIQLGRQLPDAASELARLIDSGATLHAAISELAVSYGDPARGEFASVQRDLQNGVLLDDALRAWAERTGRPDVQLLVAACRIGASHGGNLVAALEGVSSALTDSVEVADEARSLTSQSRLSAQVLMVLPVAGALLFSVLDGEVASLLLTTRTGLVLLSAGVALDMTGAMVMMWLVRWSLR